MKDSFVEKFLKAIHDAMDSVNAVIRKNGPKSKPYCIYSKTGKNLGCYPTRKQAEDRLKEIETFKALDKADE